MFTVHESSWFKQVAKTTGEEPSSEPSQMDLSAEFRKFWLAGNEMGGCNLVDIVKTALGDRGFTWFH